MSIELILNKSNLILAKESDRHYADRTPFFLYMTDETVCCFSLYESISDTCEKEDF
jgi:hypothetical protein